MLRDGFFNFDFKDAFYARELIGVDITGEDIDTQGYETLTFLVAVGRMSVINSVSYIEFLMEHADVSTAGGAGTYAIVSADDVIGLSATSLTSGIWKSFHQALATPDLSAAGSTVYAIGYRGTKRYVRIKVDTFGTVGGVSDAMAGVAILGLPANWPVQSEQAVSYGGA